MEIFGKYIFKLRVQHQWTQVELAQRLNVNMTYISKIENGKLKYPPSDELLIKLAEVLEVDETQIFKKAGKLTPQAIETILSDPLAHCFMEVLPYLTEKERKQIELILKEVS